jgi:hypothetical protein
MNTNTKQDIQTPQTAQPVSVPGTPSSLDDSFHSGSRTNGIRRGKWLKIGAIIVILIILLGGTFVLGGKLMNKPQIPTSGPTQTTQVNSPNPTSAVVSPSAAAEATANWKTYADKNNSFSFKYPNSWKIIEDFYNRLIIQSPDFEISEPKTGGGYVAGAKQGIQFRLNHEKNENFLTFEELKAFIEKNPSAYPLNFFKTKNEISLNNTPFMLSLDGQSDYGGNVSNAYFFVNQISYDATITSAENNDVLFQQILSTFKFAK